MVKLGKVSLSQKQIVLLSLLISTDLKSYVKTGGDFKNITANVVFSHLSKHK